MRHASFLALSLLLGACSLIAPYSITFTNTPGSVIDPTSSTLDLVVSAPTLAYISAVNCEGAAPLSILPVDAESEVSAVHKLPLKALEGQASGAVCRVTVTAYDKTTTEQASASIELKMPGLPLAKEGEMCGGIAAIACADGLMCQMDSTMPDASGLCVQAGAAAAVENSVQIDDERKEDNVEGPTTEEENSAPTDESDYAVSTDEVIDPVLP